MANWKYGKTQYGFLSTATSSGTLTLVAGSKQIQIFTGTQAHTMQLPDATTTSNGKGICFTVINQSTGAITVQDNGSNLIATVAAGSSADFLLTDVSTANGVWRLGTFASFGGGGVGFAGVVSKSANYTVVSGDKGYVIDVDCSAGPITITLPAPAMDFVITIKDWTGNSALNAITILTNGSELIDQAASDAISENYRAVTYLSDGVNWFRMSCFSGSNINPPDSYAPAPSYGRALFGGGGVSGTASTIIDYVTIATLGNATSFGSLTVARLAICAASSLTRGVFAGGFGVSDSAVIDYVTIATTSNATSFGVFSEGRYGMASCSSQTRAVFVGGASPSGPDAGYNSKMEYITIATTGNPTSFGDLTLTLGFQGGLGSPTRGVFAGGNNGAGTRTNNIQYITIATTGNGTNFGTLTTARNSLSGCSNATRGVYAGGSIPGNTAVIDYITIATLGNATSFGNLTVVRRDLASGSSTTRGVYGGGDTGSDSSVIDYITIATTNNAVSFGSLSTARARLYGCSNSHGGL